MKRLQCCLGVGFIGLLVAFAAIGQTVSAASAPALSVPTGLSFAEVKVTGDELLVIENNSGQPINDLSSYWLYDFNSTSPLLAGTKSASEQLPATALGAGQTLLLSSAARPTCGAAVAGNLTISLADSGGFLEIVKLSQASPTAPVAQTPGDNVSWSSGSNGIIQNVPSSSSDPAAVYYRTAVTPDNPNGWQLADIDTPAVCQLQVVETLPPAPPVDTGGLITPTSEPPATIINLETVETKADASQPVMPPTDVGLASPQITELLPNPAGTGTDNTDEFIELYNSNSSPFDLSGFMLETGTKTYHKYVFPNGTTLPAKSFKAFYSAATGLSLSNSGSQATLLDPFGKVIDQAAPYGTAKDGEAWALAKGKWYWTLSPTPNAANKIQQVNSTSTNSAKKTANVNGQPVTAIKGASTDSSSLTGAANTDDETPAPVHPAVLALVVALALGYGLFEYRHDISNQLFKYRKYRTARRAGRR